jgi:hypothetical protein
MNNLLSYFKGKRWLGRLRRTWKDNIKSVLKKSVGEDLDWMVLVQERDK